MGHPALLFSCQCWHTGGERLWWWLHPLHVTQQYHFASMIAWLSSTGISHHDLLPHIPSIHLSTVNSSPCSGIAPQTPVPIYCVFQGICVPVQNMCGCGKDCPILIPFRLPQISCLTFSLKCFSSDSDKCSNVETRPLLKFPHPLRAGPVLWTLLFSRLLPSSYWILCGSIYSSLLVRYSCLLSAGVLHVLLCQKVYSWGMQGKKCTPYPPTPRYLALSL